MSTKAERVLLVGAGAVGQAYGFHLQRGGAAVTFYVREKYRDSLSGGLPVECLNGRYRGPHLLSDYALISRLDELRSGRWDQVWLCVSSPALYTGWLGSFLAEIGDATLVMLQPGVGDYDHVTSLVPATQVVYGMITLASFFAPLDEAAVPKTMTWWFPPFSSAPFSGIDARVRSVVNSLKLGGMRAKAVRDIVPRLRVGSGILMPFIAALESAEWKFSNLRDGPLLSLAGRAAREATQLSLPNQHRLGIYFLTQTWFLKLILIIAPRCTPFNLETMLKVHFVKVGAQTRSMLDGYVEMSKVPSDSSEALERLRTMLGSSVSS